MPELTENRVLPHKSQDIFDLVMDIEKYPEFLPWCKKAKIVDRISEDNLQADLVINFKAFTEKYRSDVKFYNQEGVFIIESRAVSGPFKNLHSEWKISADKDDDKNCNIEFYISFSFNSFILEKMIGGIFERASKKMIESFEKRACLVLM